MSSSALPSDNGTQQRPLRQARRKLLTDYQRATLEMEFQTVHSPMSARRAELAMELGISERQVLIWFHNRRQRDRDELLRACDEVIETEALASEEVARELPDCWTRYALADGGSYFFGLHGNIGLVTKRKPNLDAFHLEAYVKNLVNRFCFFQWQFTSSRYAEVCIQQSPLSDYIVDHEKQTVYEFNCLGIKTEAGVHERQAAYWRHVVEFPSHLSRLVSNDNLALVKNLNAGLKELRVARERCALQAERFEDRCARLRDLKRNGRGRLCWRVVKCLMQARAQLTQSRAELDRLSNLIDQLTGQIAELQDSIKFLPMRPQRGPDGRTYFITEAGNYKGYTEVDISDSTVRKLAEAKVDRIRQAIKQELPDRRHSRMDIVVGLPRHPSSPDWSYYIVDCMRRCIVFLQAILTGLEAVYGDVGPVSGAKHWHQWRFWEHVRRYPVHHYVSGEERDQLKTQLSTWQIVTSSGSPVAYSSEELLYLIKAVEALEVKAESSGLPDSAVAELAYLLAITARFLYERSKIHSSRLRPHAAASDHVPSVSRPFRHLSLVLFGVPMECMTCLGEIMKFGELHIDSWKCFIRDMRERWTTAIGYCFMVLASNLALFAVPFLIADKSPSRGVVASDAAMFVGMTSTVFCVGSLVSGFALLKDSSRKAEDTACVIRKYFESSRESCANLALKYSLPQALLYWSLLALVTSILIVCWNTRSLAQILISALPAVLVFALLAWTWRAGRADGRNLAGSAPALPLGQLEHTRA